GRPPAVEGEIEAAIEAEVVAFPRAQNRGHGLGRNRETIPPAARDDLFGGIDAEVMKVVRGALESLDLGGREFVAGRLVPIRAGIVCVIGQADFRDLLTPGGTG